MYSRELTTPMSCGRCGEEVTKFYTFSSDVLPNLCPQCFQAMLKMIDTLALAEAPDRDLWAYNRN